MSNEKLRVTLCEEFLEEYRIPSKKLLGSGGFGFVIRCVQKRSRLEFAVKIISKAKSEDEGFQKTMEVHERESKICRKLPSHPNVIRLHNIIEGKNYFYFVFDLANGGDLLDDIIVRERYSEKDVFCIMEQILQGVNHCHKNNVVHRDLKLDNVLISIKNSYAVIKIADFGLAIEVDGDAVGKHGKHGTPGCMAPEVLKNTEYGKPVDMWSCGVILYNLLFGVDPFQPYQSKEHLIIKGKYNERLNDTVSKLAKYFVKRMLTVDPSNRITAGQALEDSWLLCDLASMDHQPKTLESLKKLNLVKKLTAIDRKITAAKRIVSKTFKTV